MHHRCHVAAHATNEISRAQDSATEVIATINIVADIGESFARFIAFLVHLYTHIGLGVSQNVGITTSGEGVEYATVAQIDFGVAADGAKEAAAIDELALCHIFAGVVLFRYTSLSATQIHRT